MNFRDFFMGMSQPEREAYAARAGTSHKYIFVAFASVKSGKPRKVPKPDLLRALVDASDGRISMAEALEYFGFTTLDELRAFFSANPEAVAEDAQEPARVEA